MHDILAFAQAAQPSPSWLQVVERLLTLLIYGLLGPAVYLTIVVVGVDLAWPGGTRMRRWLQQRQPAEYATTLRLAEDPSFRVECAVAGLIAVSVWSVVITAWLAGYLHNVPGLQLAPPQHTTIQHKTTQPATSPVFGFAITSILGLIGGYSWADGMRRAASAQASLAVLSISMSLAGALLFFYALEPSLRDVLLVLALATFSGALIVTSRHPTFVTEGLFTELFVPAQPSTSASDDLLGGNRSTMTEEPGGYYAAATWQGIHGTRDDSATRPDRGRRTVRLGE
jgi:hypothetical protein